jgi:hypothetical protein
MYCRSSGGSVMRSKTVLRDSLRRALMTITNIGYLLSMWRSLKFESPRQQTISFSTLWPEGREGGESHGSWLLLSIRVQRIWLFFRKWRLQTLCWVQNWDLRHIYRVHFFIFWAVFCAFGFKIFKKCKYEQKILFEKIKTDIQKRKISCWSRICWKSF